ncbi:uncharacterized protein [Drosophila virilis]|uniref:THAP-type domain-containing protein n=1 Tax=Drosophila virilis TaxID=7244 RepID=A0A0Q9WSI5_DROVI|nr:uncharacterized protein LOC6630669 [Drosophila virilis]KRF83694.1 uncharacterized protein Dvir_GJ22704 [Drosophila virilis]
MVPKLKRKCMAINCNASGLQDFTNLFKFPMDPEMNQKWKENLGLTNVRFLSSCRSLICRRHFTPDCHGKKKLHPWAVPTLHLGTGKTEGIHQPVKPKTILRRRKCCVRNCKVRQPDILHTFPTKPELRAKWLQICGLQDVRKHYDICRKHFRPSFLLRRKLVVNAYPELHLGLEDFDPLQAPQDSENIEFEEDNINGNMDNDEDEPLISTNSNETVEAEENEDDAGEEQICDINCNKCATQENRCREMQEEIDAMRKKIAQLEEMLHVNAKEDEDEYIWLLLK